MPDTQDNPYAQFVEGDQNDNPYAQFVTTQQVTAPPPPVIRTEDLPGVQAILKHPELYGSFHQSQFTEYPEAALTIPATAAEVVSAPIKLAGKAAGALLDVPDILINKIQGRTPGSVFNPPRETITERAAHGEFENMIPKATVPEEAPAISKVAAGIVNAPINIANSILADPGQAALMAMVPNEGALGNATRLLFGAQMGAGLPAEVNNAISVFNDPQATVAQKTEAIANPIVQGYLTRQLLKHGATEKGAQNATEERPLEEGRQPEHPGAAQGANVPENRPQVREGAGAEAVNRNRVARSGNEQVPETAQEALTPTLPEWVSKLPEQPEGTTRVYHGKGDAGQGESFWTENPERAASYGKNVEYIDLPQGVAEAFRVNGQDFNITEPEVLKAAKPAGEVPQKTVEIGGANATKPSVTETTPKTTPPAQVSQAGVVPAIRLIGGEVVKGEAGQTHPDIIARDNLKAEDIDQRGFVDAQGNFLDREQTAAKTGLPTQREASRQHSTDLPEAKLGQQKLPPLIPGERLVTIQKPDGTTYTASFGDKYWEHPARGKVPSIAKPTESGWSHGMLAPGERIIENAPEGKPAEPISATQSNTQEIPLGLNRPDVENPSLKNLSDTQFDEEFRQAKSKVNEAEKMIDEVSDLEALTREQRQQIADAQDRWSAAELERMRRNYSDIHTEDIFHKMIELADQGTSFAKFKVLAGILRERSGVKPEDVTGVYRLLPERLLSNPDFKESLSGRLEKFKEWLQRYQKELSATPAEAPKTAAGAAEPASAANVPEMVGAGAARPGEFPSKPGAMGELVKSALAPFQKLRQTIQTLSQTKGIRDIIAYTRDAGDTLANTFSNSKANEIRNALKRAFPKKDRSLAEDALSLMVESEGNMDRLTEMRQKVVDSTEASPKWKKRFFDASDFALYNRDALLPIAQRYGQITDAQVFAENQAGIDTLQRRGYVMHAQDIGGLDTGFLEREGAGSGTPFRKVRTHATFADSIAAGIDPKSLNAVDLLRTRLRRGQQLINTRAWSASLGNLIDPKTGKPITTEPTITKRADGSTYPTAPNGYSLEYAGFQPVAIHNGYEGLFTALTDPSWFRRNAAGRFFTTANATGKSLNLLIDTFHLGRIAFWQSLLKATNLEMPTPSFTRGLTLLDNSVEEIRRMAANNEIPQRWLPELLESKRQLMLAQKTGYNVGRVTDALYQDVIHNLPLAGKFNKFLFQSYQRGAMAEAWLTEFRRIRKALPDLDETEAARRVSKDLNTRFGNIGRQGWFKSRTAQDTAKFIALAPQWNEGLIKSEFGAVKQAVELARDVALGRKIYTGTLLRTVGTMALMQFAANQVINQVTRKKFTWENPEEGIGAKLSAWIPDKIGHGPGFFLHPLGLAAETTHLMMQAYEKTGDFHTTLNRYLRSRSSAAMRPVLTFITRKDFLGRTLKPGTVWTEIAKSAIPVPIAGGAIYAAGKELVTGQPSEQYPGQFQRQAMSSFGIKTDQAPSPEQRIRSLATEFNKKKGITPSGEFFTGDYSPLTTAVGIGNTTDAKAAMEDLLKKKSPTDVSRYLQSWWKHPFTGQQRREQEFYGTLTPEQKQQYQTSKQQRIEIAKKAYKLLAETVKEQNATVAH